MLKVLFAIATVSALGNSLDMSSYANIDEVVPTHLALDFAVDFNRSVFEGNIVHSLKVISTEPISTVYFDSVGIDVSKVEYLDPQYEWWQNWVDCEYTVTTPNELLG